MADPSTPPPTLQPLIDHLTALQAAPDTTELDFRLVETFTAQLTEDSTKPLIPVLVPLVSSTLPLLRTDPTPVTTLIQKLLSPVFFSDILPLTDQDTILSALNSQIPPVQHLGLFLLRKATQSPSEASIVASWTDVVRSVISNALLDPDTGVSAKCADVLVELMKADSLRAGGAGLVRRRVIGDRSVYALFYRLTAWNGDDVGSNRRKTEAQGRLLALLPRIAELDFEHIAHSRHADVEEQFQEVPKTEGAYAGLLGYAAKEMVKAKEDVMMHLVLIDYYSALLMQPSKRPLGFLQAMNVHERTIKLYLKPGEYTDDMLDQGFLESKAGEYISNFARRHPDEIVKPFDGGSQTLLDAIVERATTHLRSSPQDPHTPSLQIISAVSADASALTGKGVVELIPLQPPSAEYLSTLATVFQQKPLYQGYYSAHPELWSKILDYASTPALAQAALTAMQCLETLASTEWGVQEMLAEPNVMTWLVSWPEKFVGGAGDRESWAWRVARQRNELAMTVLRKIPKDSAWAAVLESRVRGGVWGKGEGVEVATEGGA